MIIIYKCCGYEKMIYRDFKTKKPVVKCPYCKKVIKGVEK